ncbi:MAG: hypothetical protein AABZ64_02385 [Nitrospinota bacterium]
MRGRSALAVCAGFLFWIGFAYFYYARDILGAAALCLLFVAAAALRGFFLRARRRPPRPPRPASDLPRYKFDDVKPKDFE